MKIYRSVIVLIAVCGLFAASCTRGAVSDEAAVQITTSSLEFDRDGTCSEAQAVSTVECNYDWIAYPTDASWIEVTPSSGLANTPVEVTIKVSENRKFTSREGAVNFFDKDLLSKRSCTIDQDGAFFGIDPVERDSVLTYDIESYEFTVHSNVKWTVATNNADYVPESVSGEGEKKVKINFPKNMGEDINDVDIIVTADIDEEDKADTVHLNHKCFEYYVVVPDTVRAKYFATAVEIPVDANTPWKAKAISSGISVSPTSGTAAGTVKVTIPYNAINEGKEFKVEILADKTNIKNRGGVVVIKQDPCWWLSFGEAYTIENQREIQALAKGRLTENGAVFISGPFTYKHNSSTSLVFSESAGKEGIKGSGEISFISNETGRARLTFQSGTVYYVSATASTKYTKVEVNGVVVKEYASIKDGKTNFYLKGEYVDFDVETGQKVRIYTSGTNNNTLGLFSFGKAPEE